MISLFLNQDKSETFPLAVEKSAKATVVFSTSGVLRLRLKTKSWNFFGSSLTSVITYGALKKTFFNQKDRMT